MAKKEIICAFGTDIDSVAGWIGSYGGGDSPSDIQRGIFASEVGNLRLLRLFKKYNLKTSFFIPGHSIETFPDQVKRIVDEGHEIGANWYVDDLPPMMFMKKAPNSHGFVNPRDIEDLWRSQFDWVYREMDYAVFAFTIHPDVSGRPQVLMMLERLIEYINGHDGVKWMCFEDIAADFRKRFPFGGKARPEVI